MSPHGPTATLAIVLALESNVGSPWRGMPFSEAAGRRVPVFWCGAPIYHLHRRAKHHLFRRLHLDLLQVWLSPGDRFRGSLGTESGSLGSCCRW